MKRGRSGAPAAESLGAAVDGRLRRTERSREAIVQALFDLVSEGDLRPAAHRVAERAGVGIRTVFRHFSEMDTLFAKMSERLQQEVQPMQDAAPPAGDVAARVRALARRRAALFERIAPYRRSGDLQRWRSPFLQQQHRATMRLLRRELTEWLPEIESAPMPLLDALDAALSFEVWDRLRGAQGAGRAQAAMEEMALALVARAATADVSRSPSRRGC